MERQTFSWAEKLAAFLSVVSAGFAVVIAGFITLATLMRYLVGAPFSFTEEIVGLLFVGMVFTGLPGVTLRGKHISVTIIADSLGAAGRRFLARLASVGTLVFCLWFGWLSWDYLQITLDLDARTAGSRLILWPWTTIPPVACALAAIAAALRVLVPLAPDHDAEDGGL